MSHQGIHKRLTGTSPTFVKWTYGILICLLACLRVGLAAQPVQVTLQAEKTRIEIGETTQILAYAQIAPEMRAESDRIFSWYVDLVSNSAEIAEILITDLIKPLSDNDPLLGRPGILRGQRVLGIFDTFMETPGAGRDEGVVLFSIPIIGRAVGRITFQIQPGSSVEGLSSDFLVAPTGGGTPWVGGNYSTATVSVEVLPPAQPALTLQIQPSANGFSLDVRLQFTPTEGMDYVVEARNTFSPKDTWQALQGAPHNDGLVTEPLAATQKYYRLRQSPKP